MKTISFKATDAEYEALMWVLENNMVPSASEGIRQALHLWLDSLDAKLPHALRYQLDERVKSRHRYR